MNEINQVIIINKNNDFKKITRLIHQIEEHNIKNITIIGKKLMI